MNPASEALGYDLDADTLHKYLKDPTFVEYLNSFLLLPAFTNKIFYNQETSYFEQVYPDSMVGCAEGEPATSSISTIYLLSDSLGPSLDKEQSWNWVSNHRLPLFLRSDIFSEYKICKLIASSTLSKVSTNTYQNRRLPFSKGKKHLLQDSVEHFEVEGHAEELQQQQQHEQQQSSQHQQQKNENINLPEIQLIREDNKGVATDLTTSEPELDSSAIRMTSSGSETRINRQSHSSRSERKVKWHRSLSVELLTSIGSPSQAKKLMAARKFSEGGVYTRICGKEMSLKDIQFLSTKSGIGALWKFLKGKTGEMNWLFWLDAERLKYYEGLHQQRMIKEFRERFFHSSNVMELPIEIRHKVGRATCFTIDLVEELQEAMVSRLIEYWCPRFVLHHRAQQESGVSTTPQLPIMFRPYSSTLETTDYQQLSENSYAHITNTPLTPSRTPTFKRASSISLSRPMSSLLLDANSREGIVVGTDSIRPQTVSGTISGAMRTPTDKRLNSSKATGSLMKTRQVWGKKVDDQDPPQRKSKGISKMSALDKRRPFPARYRQLAKYSPRHFPRPCSRCASRMDGSGREGMCKNCCTILSISGTPVRSTRDSNRGIYEPLFHCLAVEYRKAGGYFMKFLEKIEDKVYYNSLMFWREVQEYKVLFVREKFSPCTVEMRAKAIFSQYICNGCSKSIKCNTEIVDVVSFNLWPAYEDLYDLAEEHALNMLMIQWKILCMIESRSFRQLDTVGSVQRRIKEADPHTSDQEMSVDYVSSDHDVDRSPAISLNDILNDPTELEFFKMFLNEKLAAQDLMCWMDIEAFRGIPVSDRVMRNYKAKQIRKRYLNKSYYFGPNSPASKEAQRQTVQAGGGKYGSRLPPRPGTPVLREVQKHVRSRLERKWLHEFLRSAHFLKRNEESRFSTLSQAKSSSSVKSHQKNAQQKRGETFMHSHEAIKFRKFLKEKKKCGAFQKYLKIKTLGSGGFSGSALNYPEENMAFWREVQMYKKMFHAHTKESTLRVKLKAIIDCFITSSTPPELQVDILPSMAEVMSKKHLGPYIFREAQAVIFSNLYTGWKDFNTFALGYNEDELENEIEGLKKEILTMQRKGREQEDRQLHEDQRKDSHVPRFETLEERDRRIEHEREIDSFGPISVAFRLSTPDPYNCIYFTELPEDYITEDAEKEGTIPKESSKTTTIMTEEESAIMMKMKRNKKIPQHINQQRARSSQGLSQTTESHCRTSVDVEEPQDEECQPECQPECPTSSSQGSVSYPASKPPRKPTMATRQTLRKISVARSVRTISMRASSVSKGETFAYGAGLPDDKSSYLEIKSQS